jgi:archaemetzincin
MRTLTILLAGAVGLAVVLAACAPTDTDWRNMDMGQPGGDGVAGSRTLTPEPVPEWALGWGDDLQPLPTPGPGDWLDMHFEPGQSFTAYVSAMPNRPDTERSVLVLQPLGRFDHPGAPPVDLLRRFTEAYFGMPAQSLEPIDLDVVEITSRRERGLRQRQLLTGDLLELLRANLPEHAFSYVGITMEDLYPGPDWNYVFGQASLRDRVAVYSFVRYLPEFWGERRTDPRLVLRRSCKVLAHETAHAFGLRHCIAHLCIMNGSNHLEESDSRPLHLCPTDLRKLEWNIGFDVAERYRRLTEVYRELGLDDEAEWVKRRLHSLGG